MKAPLEQLFLQTLEAIALHRVIPTKVSCNDGLLAVGDELIELSGFERLFVVALGKAAFPMLDIISDILPSRPLMGVVSGVSPDPTSPNAAPPGFAFFEGGHPYPNADSFASADALLERLAALTAHDLVLYLLSGGGSAICEKPISARVSDRDCRQLYELLVTCGLNILEVNFIRKHLSAIKGGRLTAAAFPARQLTLYVSDAPPDSPSNVASGPTMGDESRVRDCQDIIRRAGLSSRLPASVRRLFDAGDLPETPKPGDPIFEASSWHCLLEPEDAAAAMARAARDNGWQVETDLTIDDDCPLQRATGRLLERLEALRSRHRGSVVAVVSAGEYSCPVLGDGRGGRNQAFVLDCVPRIAGHDIAVLSAGTDGIDGTSPAAGAFADGTTLARARKLGLDSDEFAQRSDSYGFFSALGDALITGPTGNNVRDLRILVAW